MATLSKKASKLIQKIADYNFDCGEWQEGDDQAYLDVSDGARKAQRRLEEYIAKLEEKVKK